MNFLVKNNFLKLLVIVAGLLVVSQFSSEFSSLWLSARAQQSSPKNNKLLQKIDLKYLGAFRVPQGEFGSPRYTGFNYGGTALAYNSKNNSLFVVGHNHHQLVAEISIPEIVNSNNLDDLKTASVLQPFTDITEGNMSRLGEGGVEINTSGTPLGGLMVWDEKLIGTAFGYYDAGKNVKLSHFTSSLNLAASGDFSGMYKVQNLNYSLLNPAFVDGYMTPIPKAWQTEFGGPALTGNCCLSIISRTSFGPAVSVFDPDDLGLESPVLATPLVGYPSGHTTLGTYGDQNPDSLYNGSMEIKGVVFPSNSRSVLFFGRRGVGDFCYGFGVSDPALHKTQCSTEYPTVDCCYDLASSSKGGHSYPYKYQVFAYDALDLLSVKAGEKQPWDIMPYGVWELELPFTTESASISGVAYDPVTQRIYVSQYGADRPGCCGRLPVIHVFEVQAVSDSSKGKASGSEPTSTPVPETDIQPDPVPTPSPTYISNTCAPLPAPDGNIISVTPSQAADLPKIISSSPEGSTILLSDGTYNISQLYITTPGLTIRGKSGSREAAVLDGNYQSGQSIIAIRAKDITVADLTIKRSFYHPIHVAGGGDNTLVYNVHIIDGGQQFVKINPSSSGEMNDNGVVACSLFELTDSGRPFIEADTTSAGYPCYTGGVDAHKAWGWTVRDNIFKNIYCTNGGLSEHAIHFWSGSGDTVVERNTIISSGRGVGFGLTSSGVDHTGGIVRNNVIYGKVPGNPGFDSGISLWNAKGAKVYNNTIYYPDTNAFSSIEARFANASGIDIKNNLLFKPVMNRNGASFNKSHNITNASPADFINSANGNLRLAANSTAVDAGLTLSLVEDDMDNIVRPVGSAYDVGAYEHLQGSDPVSVPAQDNDSLKVSEPAFVDSSEESEEKIKLRQRIENLKIKVSELERKVIALEKRLTKKINKLLTHRLKGKILLQVEENGEAWYVDPDQGKRHYLADGPTAYEILRTFGLGITNQDLSLIPVGIEERADIIDTDSDGLDDKLEEALGTDINNPDTDSDGFTDGDEVKSGNNPLGTGKLALKQSLIDRLEGKILLQVESRGEAWYIHNGQRYYMKDGNLAYQIMRFLSLGITNQDLRQVEVGELNNEQ